MNVEKVLVVTSCCLILNFHNDDGMMTRLQYVYFYSSFPAFYFNMIE